VTGFRCPGSRFAELDTPTTGVAIAVVGSTSGYSPGTIGGSGIGIGTANLAGGDSETCTSWYMNGPGTEAMMYNGAGTGGSMIAFTIAAASAAAIARQGGPVGTATPR
jgi:hypothetical protein